jgi:hypothetical protein
MDMALRFMAIAHVWSSGDIEYVNLLDNGSLTTVYMDGAHVPPWLSERVALLRLCDVNKDTKGESLGRKFTEHMLYVYLTYDEHKELNEIVKSEGVQNEEAK